mgnify:CR=1 FL=1
MGCDRQFTCRTCLKSYYLGYGSYSTWLGSEIKTFADFEAFDSPHKALRKNQNFGRCLQEHEGHEWKTWSWEYCSESNGNLYLAAWYVEDLLIEGFGTFEYTNLDEDT